MKELKIKQIPNHVSAVRKNGNFLRMQADNAKGPLFLQEVTKDCVGMTCTDFDITMFGYDKNSGTVELYAGITFPENCEHITLQADLLDAKTDQVICSLEEKTAENCQHWMYEFDGKPAGMGYKPESLAVMLYAEWAGNDGVEGEAALFEDGNRIRVEYDHFYPKKEKEGYVTFGTVTSETAKRLAQERRDAENRIETNNIMIALYREPDDTKDLDYLCKFGKEKGKENPQVCVPGRGLLKVKKSGDEFVCDDEHPIKAVCTITPVGNGNALVVAAATCNESPYETVGDDIKLDVTASSILYDMTGPWTATFYESGDFTLHDFDYELTISCSIRSGGVIYPCLYYVTSKDRLKDLVLQEVPRVTIKWGCLAAGTKIRMEDGTEEVIEKIHKGHHVQTDGGIAAVRTAWSGTDESCECISVDDGRELILTKSHPVLTANGWKQAGELTCWDVLKTESGGEAAICKIERVAGTHQVYNLDTEGKVIYANGFAVGDFARQNNQEKG